jgi:tetratricopeptide (TPR) repeat protein
MGEQKVPPRPARVLDAYRRTQPEVRQALDTGDAQWLRVGALLENACLLPPDKRQQHLAAVIESVRATLGAERWAEGHRMDPFHPDDDRSLEARFRTYCEIVEESGALSLADAMLAAYVDADPDVSALERARVEAVRARLAWKSGDLDAAIERYRRVAQAAKRERSDELRVRALVGEAIAARHRGNYPRSRERAQKAARLAERRGMHRLAALSYQTLTVPAAIAGEFGPALEYGWRAYLHAVGEPTMESETLSNIGQLFLDLGHPVPATAAFRAVIARASSDRVLIPALGGLAMAASRTGDREVVAWVQREVAMRARAGATPYVITSAQLDLARAWADLQVPERAESARREALAIALEHRFHEFVHHAEVPFAAAAPARQVLSASGEEIADSVLQLVGA